MKRNCIFIQDIECVSLKGESVFDLNFSNGNRELLRFCSSLSRFVLQFAAIDSRII